MGSQATARSTRTKKPAPKEQRKKKTLHEAANTMLQDMLEKKREEALRESRERHKQEEDAVMAIMYGPNWRDRSDIP